MVAASTSPQRRQAAARALTSCCRWTHHRPPITGNRTRLRFRPTRLCFRPTRLSFRPTRLRFRRTAVAWWRGSRDRYRCRPEGSRHGSPVDDGIAARRNAVWHIADNPPTEAFVERTGRVVRENEVELDCVEPRKGCSADGVLNQ